MPGTKQKTVMYVPDLIDVTHQPNYRTSFVLTIRVNNALAYTCNKIHNRVPNFLRRDVGIVGRRHRWVRPEHMHENRLCLVTYVFN